MSFPTGTSRFSRLRPWGPDSRRPVRSRPRRGKRRSGTRRPAMARWRRGKSSGGGSSRRGPKPSKPWGCRSKTLTPTPEPAGYCAGDVQENVEILRRAILGWNDRGAVSLIEHLHPEVDSHPPGESMNPGPFRGPDGVREYFAWIDRSPGDQRVESVEVIEVDDDRSIAVVNGSARTEQFDGRLRDLLGLADHRLGSTRDTPSVQPQRPGPRSGGAVGARLSRRLLRLAAIAWVSFCAVRARPVRCCYVKTSLGSVAHPSLLSAARTQSRVRSSSAVRTCIQASRGRG